jgi:hypothetical protein
VRNLKKSKQVKKTAPNGNFPLFASRLRKPHQMASSRFLQAGKENCQFVQF